MKHNTLDSVEAVSEGNEKSEDLSSLLTESEFGDERSETERQRSQLKSMLYHLAKFLQVMPLDRVTLNNPPKCNVKLKEHLLECNLKSAKKNQDLRQRLDLNNHGQEFKIKATAENKKYISESFEPIAVNRDGYISLVGLIRSIIRQPI